MEKCDYCDILYTQIKNHSSHVKINTSIKNLLQLFNQTKLLFKNEPAILHLHGDFTVIGDIHGDSEILFRIFSKMGYPDRTKYIFLGDYVDRGKHSVDVLTILFTLKCLYPDNVYMIRGNHECRSLNSIYGFLEECQVFYNEKIYEAANQCFDELPLAVVLNETVFCVHGGISQNIKSVDDLEKVKKYDGEPIQGTTETDFLWSDPSSNVVGYQISNRGAGHLFGEDAAQQFLNTFGLKLIVRSHETCSAGFDIPFNGNGIVLTIFTSPDYCGNQNNASIVSFSEENSMNANIETFTAFRKSTKPFPVPSFIAAIQEARRVEIRANDLSLDSSDASIGVALNLVSVLCS